MFSPFFSHIYIENKARDYPLAHTCLQQFPKAQIVEIDNYKEVFNRPRQDWQLQSKSRKLILAVKPDDFLYSNSELVPSFNNQHSFYNAHVLNCLYNCSYCYLQGLYQSANIVVFVNSSDFTAAASKALSEFGSIYLCISYDTDLLAFEKILGLNRLWIEFARANPGILIETRTKSNNFSQIADLEPTSNFILAWTLSPDPVQKQKELLTASFAKRLAGIQTAIGRGWKVRLCLDPILYSDNWKLQYQDMLGKLTQTIDLSQVYDVSVGSFRINNDFLKSMRKQKRFDPVIFYPYQVQDNIASYPAELKQELLEFVRSRLFDYGLDPARCVSI